MRRRDIFVRNLDPGMGIAVASRTYFRKNEDWGDLAYRVALGNTLLHPSGKRDLLFLEKSIAKGALLTAGRHLQHGDETQPTRNLEIFSNCSTSCTSFIQLYLLLNGSGVGRNYSDEFMVTDWRNLPKVTLCLGETHPDYSKSSVGVSRETANREKFNHWFTVPDSREGWAQALELLETLTFEKQSDVAVVLDFSLIRKAGMPIKGMQGRPSSGPIVLMEAFEKIVSLRDSTFEPWKQTMMIDHYAAECVANGGARRSARIAVKYWKDKGIFDFINIKRDNPWMWSSNNSVGVDHEFWELVKSENGSLAKDIFNAMTEASFSHGTGEPGFLSLDKLTVNDEGLL